ncbi:HAD family phosphatase [Candidatus Woesearchaeota archaeon]|nr:HAD family phosphatase [Candidatus Woesearchaeota archaeon]
MIKAILFDFGNVICSFENQIFLTRISPFTNVPIEVLRKGIYGNGGMTNQLESGKLTGAEFMQKVKQITNTPLSHEALVRAYTDVFVPIPSTYALIRSLKGKYKLGLISNISDLDYENTLSKNIVLGYFDTITLSYMVQALKPDAKIYEDALQKLGVQPQECVFIDDLHENVKGAKKLGMHAIHYTGHEALVAALKGLNVSF